MANENQLSTATAFVVEHNGPHLITNYHVVAARNPITGDNLHPSGAWPDEVIVLHNVAGQLGAWQPRKEPVRNAAGPLWLEHPTHGRRVDVVALPLTQLSGVKLHAHSLDKGVDLAIGVAQGVSIIGFPFGQTGGGLLGVWVQGTIATEPSINFDELPCFLVDSRTRPGQSGSPVLLYRDGGMIPMADGGVSMFAGPIEKLLGVYSGRINEQSDLGIVWRREVIAEIIDGGNRASD